MIREVLLSIAGGIVALVVVMIGVPLMAFGNLWWKGRQR